MNKFIMLIMTLCTLLCPEVVYAGGAITNCIGIAGRKFPTVAGYQPRQNPFYAGELLSSCLNNIACCRL